MNRLLNYNPEVEFLNEGNVDRTGEYELELGADLLEISNEFELEEFLQEVIAKVSPRGRQAVSTPLGTMLIAALKRVAGPVLPIRNVLATYATSTASGVTSTNDLKGKAEKIFGIELEGLSPEDKEFEVAQQFVRFVADTIKRSSNAEITDNPQRAVEAALAQAARQHAPGLLIHKTRSPPSTGHWSRYGNRIVVFDCY